MPNRSHPTQTTRHAPCLCNRYCGDVPEEDDPYGVCKVLPSAPKPPLVEIVMVPRDAR